MNTQAQTQTKITSLLNELSPENLQLVEQFVRFLREQARRGRPIGILERKEKKQPYLYPTVAVPASSLDNWLNLVPEGYQGDALKDSEALYDEA